MKKEKIQKALKKKVYVGMSGGVDSSVSAALLVKAGYDVTGVFIKVWQPDRDISGLVCTWREDRLDAMRVAAKLGIRFVTLDLENEYKKNVVDYMIEEYRRGRTPNPDVMCNKYVKFGGFFDWAMKQGADYVATGHYAQVIERSLDDKTIYDLVAGDDINKDQSYFLWTLTQEQLSKTLFPVGMIEKPEVRTIARAYDLPTAEKKDSQGLCFIGKIDIKQFLSHYIESKSGDVLDEKGLRIGTHGGSAFFTFGERHGFIIDEHHKTPHDTPYYVVGKDVAQNTITVSQKSVSNAHNVKNIEAQNVKNAKHAVQKIILTNVNWTRGQNPQVGVEGLYYARPRYRAPLVPIVITSLQHATHKNAAEITYQSHDESISPGQSLVIYEGAVCIGGGIIDSV